MVGLKSYQGYKTTSAQKVKVGILLVEPRALFLALEGQLKMTNQETK